MYLSGQVVRFTASFQDINGNPIDPTVVAFLWKVANGPSTQYTFGVDAQVERDGTGVYHCDIDTTGQPGTLSGEWASDGVGQTVGTAGVNVRPAPMRPTFP